MNGGMWVFGAHGLKIFTADGSLMLRDQPASAICPKNEEGMPECTGFDYLTSDGQKYVWTAANSRQPFVEAFDASTGDFVGRFETCDRTRDMKYLPKRDEMWLRCGRVNEQDGDRKSGHWDYFKTNSISTNYPEISLKESDPSFNETSWGRAIYRDDVGTAYTTDWRGGAVVHKVDLDSKTPVGNITLPLTAVCCTCGSPGADAEECQAYGDDVHMDNVTVLTGPSANADILQVGGCGAGCAGSPADTVGIYEIDTKTDTIVATHPGTTGFGVGDPIVTPNGKCIVMFEEDTQKLRILE
ncbi:MAG: hypothetical protein SGARI_002850, partial [Bacillariaceae sp.]